MSGLGARVRANLLWLVLFSATVILAAFLRFATSGGFEDPYVVTAAMPEAGGLLAGQEVTVLGRAVGLVSDVVLTEDGVDVEMEVPHQFEVPASATVSVLRRSPIGEQAIDLRPTSPDWEAAEPGSEIEVTEAVVPAEIPFLLERTVDLFSAIESEDLTTVIHELALALEGRGQTLVRLNRDSRDLNRTLVDGIPTFERLTGPATVQMLDTLRDSASDIGESFDNAAALSELLAQEAPTMEELLRISPTALSESSILIQEQSANVGCILGDFIDLNQMVTGPSTWDGTDRGRYSSKLHELERALQLHEFFFQGGFAVIAQPDYGMGVYWQRIDLQVGKEAGGQRYPQKRPTPATRPGAACVSDAFGLGVNAVRQADHQPPDETAPPIDFAPLADGQRARGSGVDAPPLGTVDRDGGLAATGGGVLIAAPLLLGLALLLRRRR